MDGWMEWAACFIAAAATGMNLTKVYGRGFSREDHILLLLSIVFITEDSC